MKSRIFTFLFIVDMLWQYEKHQENQSQRDLSEKWSKPLHIRAEGNRSAESSNNLSHSAGESES